MSARRRGAHVRVPPPIIFLGGWLLAWALHRRLPFDIDGRGAGAVQLGIGVVLAAGGVALMGWAIRTLLFARTTVLPNGVVRCVVTTGPFAVSRNPIYVGMTAIYTGAALAANLAWPLIVLPIALATLTTLVVAREERHLRETFGAEYDAYAARVRRWL